jgi:hypothetical protein
MTNINVEVKMLKKKEDEFNPKLFVSLAASNAEKMKNDETKLTDIRVDINNSFGNSGIVPIEN